MPAHGADAAGTKLIKTCNSMCIPFPLLPCLLDQEHTARLALESLVPIIEDLALPLSLTPAYAALW